MANEDDDGMVSIPAEFWGHFLGDPVKSMTNPDNPLESRKLYSDGRQTYENWLTGDFAVWFADGTTQQARNVMVNAADVLRAFPPRSVQ